MSLLSELWIWRHIPTYSMLSKSHPNVRGRKPGAYLRFCGGVKFKLAQFLKVASVVKALLYVLVIFVFFSG